MILYEEPEGIVDVVCRVCAGDIVPAVTTVRNVVLYRCPTCTAAFAQYPVDGHGGSSAVATADHFAGLDLDRYFRSVKQTRERSYSELLERLRPYCSAGRWLDVGCSYGWLMQFMQQQGYDVEGVEPSPAAATHAEEQGLIVHRGLFPQAVAADERYDVISLMDVLEHLPSPAKTLSAARSLLTSEGVLLIQVPDQQCFLYRMAEWLHRGSGGRYSFALERLWLMQFDFPHQTYFTRQALAHVLQRNGWRILDEWRSPLGSPAEALDRVSYTRGGRANGWSDSLVALGVAGIQLLDNACGHGGLINVIASCRK